MRPGRAAAPLLLLVLSIVAGPVLGGCSSRPETRETGARPSPARTSPPPSVSPVRPGVPVELRIRKLDVRAPVVPVDMRADRTLPPPPSPTTVGWWRAGPRPGQERGSALLIGHTGHIRGQSGVGRGALGRIGTLKPGDDIRLETESGILRYRVDRVVPQMTYAQVARNAPRIDDRTYPGGRLVLITCRYDGTRFTGNTLLFARPA